MFAIRVLLGVLVLMCCLQKGSAGRPDSVDSMDTRFFLLEERIAVLEQILQDKEDAQILLYRDRSDCPAGYQPMENANGRMLMIGDSRGSVSLHSITDKYSLDMPCRNVIGVAESGFHKVCNINDANSTSLTVDVKKLIPHVVLLGCARMDPSRPVVP